MLVVPHVKIVVQPVDSERHDTLLRPVGFSRDLFDFIVSFVRERHCIAFL